MVGVDGSPGSLAALRWAVREASGRRIAVHAVTVWDFPVESTFADTATVGEVHPLVAAERILVSALVDTGVAADDETVTTALMKGHHSARRREMAPELSEGVVPESIGHTKLAHRNGACPEESMKAVWDAREMPAGARPLPVRHRPRSVHLLQHPGRAGLPGRARHHLNGRTRP
ncbi:universal stress protein [Pseudonocardia halophobica]|uniref:universal stress protein n=1 Tax=Pseudonocardia halophobica TaxID=29401 RepID=UPI003D91BAB9